MQCAISADPINVSVYQEALENWALYCRRDGIRQLYFKSKEPFYLNSAGSGIDPDEADAELPERALIKMNQMPRNELLVEWLKVKYLNCLTDIQMASRYKFGYAKSKQIRVVALNVFGGYYEVE